jgi:hypothetical protein
MAKATLGTSVSVNASDGSHHDGCGSRKGGTKKGKAQMKILMTALFAGALAFSVPAAMADDIVISPEVGMHFHSDVKAKKIKTHKYDGDLKVGVVVPADVEYYDVPADVVVATPALKGSKYVYLNDHVYVVEPESRKIVAVVK